MSSRVDLLMKIVRNYFFEKTIVGGLLKLYVNDAFLENLHTLHHVVGYGVNKY